MSWKVSFVSGRRAAIGIEGLEKWVFMTWEWCQIGIRWASVGKEC